jgi:hypothetical protein
MSTHQCFMPGLAEQHKRMEDFTAPFAVVDAARDDL